MLIKIHKAIQIAVMLSVLLCAFASVRAQICFKNPSFESDTTGPFPPPDWHIFDFFAFTVPDIRYTYLDYFPAYNGKTYIGIGQAHQGDTTIKEGFYQTLPCTLFKSVKYSFSFFATSLDDLENPHKYRRGGGVSIWLSDQNLNKDQLIYRVCEIDTNHWAKIELKFKPSKNFNTIIFESYQTCNSNSFIHEVFFDYLSPITFNNKDYIKATTSDTLIKAYKPVKLSCTSIEDSVTYTWGSEPPGFNSSDSSPTVNPTQTTTYIVTAHFKCGLDVSDTVKVRVEIPHPPPPVVPFVQTYIVSNNNWTIQSANTPINVQVFNALGQLLYSNTNYQNTYNPTKVGLASGLYFYIIGYGSGYEERGKMMVIR